MPSLAERLAQASPEVRKQIFDSFETPEEREAYARWWDAQSGWRATPATMANHLTGGEWKLWRYTKLLGECFRDAVTGQDPHQIHMLASQYGKTSNLVWGILWALDRDPTARIMYVSYDADRAVMEGGRTRDLVQKYEAHLQFQLRPDQRARGLWATTKGGSLYCVGINGAITGFPQDIVLCDDLLKGWEAAHSPAQREHVWNVYRSQIRMRVQSSRDPIILAGTRWHEDDPQARLRALAENPHGDQWKIVRLPTVAEAPDPRARDPLLREPDPLGRAPGELLEPERFPLEEVQARRVSLGEYLWNSMEAQRPAPQEGGEFKRAWWKLDGDNFSGNADEWASFWDMKLKEKESGDYTVGQIWARTGKDCWMLDQLRGQWSQATTVNAIALVHVRHRHCRKHFVENTGYGPEVMDALRRPAAGYSVSDDIAGQLGMTQEERDLVSRLRRQGVPGIIPYNPKGSKIARARAQAGAIEAGDVHLPPDAPWLGIFMEELSAFPQGLHDDMVDCVSAALARLHKRGTYKTRTYGEELRNTHASPIG